MRSVAETLCKEQIPAQALGSPHPFLTRGSCWSDTHLDTEEQGHERDGNEEEEEEHEEPSSPV
jgi:hypothetical protein